MIALTVLTDGVNGEMDSRFGRCEYFVLYDRETSDSKVVENEAKRAGSGAGVSAAQFLADQNVQVVITGEIGPKAKRALQAAEITTFIEAEGTVIEALKDYQNGRLTQAV